MAPLHVGYHRQDTGNYCGPATALMILRALTGSQNVGLPVFALGEAALDHAMVKHLPWATYPDSLAKLLSDKAAKGFMLHTCADADAAARILAQAFSHDPAVPAAILLYGCSHWSVVCGVTTVPAVPLAGNSFTVTAFYLNIPAGLDPLALPPPPPHSDSDSCPQNVHWPGNTMFSPLFWKCERQVIPCTSFQNKVAVICGTLNPNLGPMTTPICPVFAPSGPGFAEPGLDDAGAARVALAGVREHGLFEERKGEPQLSARESSVVERLDQPGESYRLVPLYRAHTYLGMALVDRRIGFGGAHSASPEPPIRSADEVAHVLLHSKPNPPIKGYKDGFHPGDFTVDETLVWRPCVESATPFQPFHRVVTKGGPTFYVRALDDAIVLALTRPGLGS